MLYTCIHTYIHTYIQTHGQTDTRRKGGRGWYFAQQVQGYPRDAQVSHTQVLVKKDAEPSRGLRARSIHERSLGVCKV